MQNKFFCICTTWTTIHQVSSHQILTFLHYPLPLVTFYNRSQSQFVCKPPTSPVRAIIHYLPHACKGTRSFTTNLYQGQAPKNIFIRTTKITIYIICPYYVCTSHHLASPLVEIHTYPYNRTSYFNASSHLFYPSHKTYHMSKQVLNAFPAHKRT